MCVAHIHFRRTSGELCVSAEVLTSEVSVSEYIIASPRHSVASPPIASNLPNSQPPRLRVIRNRHQTRIARTSRAMRRRVAGISFATLFIGTLGFYTLNGGRPQALLADFIIKIHSRIW